MVCRVCWQVSRSGKRVPEGAWHLRLRDDTSTNLPFYLFHGITTIYTLSDNHMESYDWFSHQSLFSPVLHLSTYDVRVTTLLLPSRYPYTRISAERILRALSNRPIRIALGSYRRYRMVDYLSFQTWRPYHRPTGLCVVLPQYVCPTSPVWNLK